MRISDWSSDVCSSDLVRPDGSLAHPDGHSSHPDLLLVGYEWKLRPSPAKQRTEIVIDQMRELSARLGLSSGSERSEEHTSELQSLMRSSYAVFCLKKKKKKTKASNMSQ